MLRRIAIALLFSSSLTLPAHADPIFTPIALALFQAGAGVAVTNAVLGIGVLGSIASTVGTLALGLGVSYVSSLFASKPQAQKPSDGQVELKQTVPPRVFHYGRVKVGGTLAFYESRGGALYKAVMLSSREIDGIEQLYLDDRKVTLGNDENGIPNAVLTPPYKNVNGQQNVYITTHLGTDTQTADTQLTGAFAEWTTNHRLRGTAYAVLKCNSTAPESFNARYPNGEPQFSALIRGSKLYDPRKDSTVPGGSGAHRSSSPSTWEWSDNAALAVLDYLIFPDGYDRPISKIDLPSFMVLANLCDEAVPLATGGTEERYRIATTISMDRARKDVLAILLAACDATLYPTSTGKIAIRGGKWEEPTVTIDADLGHIIETNFAPPDAMSRYNELSIQYLDTSLDYVENEGTPWTDVDDYALTGELVTQPLDLVQVPSQGQARRLAKIQMARDNCDWVGEIVTNMAGLNCIGERVIRLKWPELDIDGPYWVEGGPELVDTMTGVRLSLRSANSAAYDWTTAEEGTSTSIPPDTSPVFDLTAPTITLTQTAGPSIRADWTASTALNRTYEVQYRDDLDGPYVSMTVSDFRDSAVSGTLAFGTYHVRIRMSAGSAAVGDWSDDYTIALTNKNVLTATDAFDNAAWSKAAVTVTANATTAPDGTATADFLAETTATTQHITSRTASIVAGSSNVFSIYLKANGRTKAQLNFYSSPGFSFYARATVDLVAKTAVASGNGTSYASTIEDVGSGWLRISIAGILNATSTAALLQIVPQNDAGATNYAGDITKGLYAWGAQFEAGTAPTYYQPNA